MDHSIVIFFKFFFYRITPGKRWPCHPNVGKENVIIKEDLFFLNVTTTATTTTTISTTTTTTTTKIICLLRTYINVSNALII